MNNALNLFQAEPWVMPRPDAMGVVAKGKCGIRNIATAEKMVDSKKIGILKPLELSLWQEDSNRHCKGANPKRSPIVS